MSTSTKIRETLQAKRSEAKAAWDTFEPLREQIGADGFDGSTTEGKALLDEAHTASKAYSTVNEECISLEDQYGKALEMDGVTPPSKDSPFGTDAKDAQVEQFLSYKTPGQRVTESDGYKEAQRQFLGAGSFNVAFKALSRDEHIAMLGSRYAMKTLLASGNADVPADPGQTLLRPQRLPGYLELLVAPLKLRNLITVGATDNNTVEWIRQTARTTGAVEVAEATASGGSSGTKPESAMAFDLQHSVVETIAHYIPATRAALADMAQLRTIIDSQLIDGVARRLNTQILKGNGSAPNLKGILAQPILDQDDSVSGVTGARKIERIMAAITQVRLAFMEPSAVLLHPNDYQEIRLAKDANGQYYFGPPSQSGESTIWGVPMVEDVTVDEGQPVVGDWSQAILYVREDVSVVATDSHSDWFVRNMIAILAEGRYALAVPRPEGFCTVDFSTAESASTGWS